MKVLVLNVVKVNDNLYKLRLLQWWCQQEGVEIIPDEEA